MMINRLKGLGATLVILAILAGLPAVLLALGPPVALTRFTTDPIGALLRPDDGTLALAFLWVLGWAVWAILAVLIGIETIAALRQVRAPKLGPLHAPQSLAGRLVGAAALLFVATSSLPVPALAAPTPAAPVTATTLPEETNEPAPTEPEAALGVERYTVQLGDSLWRIAEWYLGDGARYPEILNLNRTLLRAGPDFLQPGWQLTLPSHATSEGERVETITVKRGDSLSQLAATHLGDAARYPEIFDASTIITQPDGRHLTDPDLIDIGWTLHIPHPAEAAEDTPEGGQPSLPAAIDPTDADAPAESAPPPTTAPSTGAERSRAADPAQVVAGDAASDEGEQTGAEPALVASWLVPGLAAGGLLCGSLALALARRRALQARHRRPGRAMPLTPAVLAPIEKTVLAHPAVAVTVDDLDRILRWTANAHVAANLPLPTVAAIELTATRIVLHLAEPQTVVAPWHAESDSDLRWILDLAEAPNLDAPPTPSERAWPQLVTIGTTEAGATWLINVEEAGALHLVGDPTYAADLARYLVAELTLNPWARDVRVDCINTCPELTDLEPGKLQHHTTLDILDPLLRDANATANRLAMLDVPDVTHARARSAGDDLWGSRVLVIDAHIATTPEVTGLLQNVLDQPHRTGTSLLIITDTDQPTPGSGVQVRLTAEGRVVIPSVGLDLIAVGLTSDEAGGVAQLMQVADQTADEPMPALTDPTQAWEAHSNAAGQLVDPRLGQRGGHEADGTTLMSEPDEAYLATATTPEELGTLAPIVPDEVRHEVEDADPSLDADLIEWFAKHSDRPRLSILGPLTVRIGRGGNAVAGAKQRPFLTQLLAYLGTRPRGVTVAEVAEATGIATDRVRRDISNLRQWIGTDPTTGQLHIPGALESETSHRLGGGRYEVNGLLVDADLFRRLRVRGEARGRDGLPDLKKALTLVTGQPLRDIRLGSWLVDSGLNHHLTYAIVDTAHLVCTIALANHDHAAARAAAELAILAAPHEEIPRLDLIAVATAEGRRSEADHLIRATLNGDTTDTPHELSARADAILNRHETLRDAKVS